MTLTGDAARKWLEEHPNSAYEDLNTGQTVERQRSGIEKLGLGLTKPFRQGLGIAGEFGGTIGDLIRMARGDHSDVGGGLSRDIGNFLLTQEEEDQLKADPLKVGLKSGAGVAAYGIPGGSKAATVGGRIVGAGAKSALSGTLAGFGASEDDEELMSALKGAGLGFLIGGGIQAGGEAVGAIKTAKLGKGGKARKYLAKQRGEAIGLDPNKIAKSTRNSISSSTKADEVIDNYFKNMDDLGYSTRTSNIASESADKAIDLYSGEFGELLRKADGSTVFTSDNTLNILDNVENVVGGNKSVMNNSTVKELFGDLYSLGDNYKPSQLNAVREKARQMINWSRSSSKMPITERGTKAIFDSIDDFFKSPEGLPTSSDILGKMRDIYTVRPYIQGKAQLGDVIKLGTASTNVNLPTLGINEAIQGGIGKAAQGLPSGGAGTGTSGGILSNLIPGMAKATQRVGPAIAGQMVGQQAPMEQQIQPQGLDQSQGQGITNQNLQEIQFAMAQAIMSGQISATEAEAILGLLGMGGTSGGGSQTESQMDYATAASALEQSYRVLETTGGAGKIPTALGGISEFFGGTTASTEYSASLEIATALIRKALIGAGQTEIELKNLNLPTPNDEPAVAKMKIESILPILRQRAGGQGY